MRTLTIYLAFEKCLLCINSAVNNLIGSIPNELALVFGLREINLFYNSINGRLPDFDGLINLSILNLQENLITGTAFPSSVMTLPRLMSYRVSDNILSGEIPTEIGTLLDLEDIWAGGNELAGSIPSEIGNLRGLKTIYLNDNALTGKIPSELGLITLEVLVMNENKFLGTVPSELWNVASLYTIVLSGNFLEGTLPNTIGQLTDLETFRVEDNNLSGRIPSTIGTMTSLGEIYHRVILLRLVADNMRCFVLQYSLNASFHFSTSSNSQPQIEQ